MACTKSIPGSASMGMTHRAAVLENHGRLVFIGDCTADLADGYDGTFVPGCPPEPDDILDALAKAGALE